MREVFHRIVGWWRRYLRARRLAIPYYRDKYWSSPSKIRLNGKLTTISMPQDHGTRIAFKDIFLDDVYGLRQLPSSAKSFLDVGAHAGLFSLCARNLFPDATIHAYEPNPDLAEHLQKNATVGQFTALHEAVGLSGGLVTLSRTHDSVYSQTFEDPEGNVPQISIDQAIDRIGGMVDVLKLDCEGCEWRILKQPSSLSAVNFLTMEYHLLGEHSLAEIQKLVRRHGFEIIFVHEDAVNNGRIWARRQDVTKARS